MPGPTITVHVELNGMSKRFERIDPSFPSQHPVGDSAPNESFAGDVRAIPIGRPLLVSALGATMLVAGTLFFLVPLLYLDQFSSLPGNGAVPTAMLAQALILALGMA